jgi:hypothetical protein
MESDVNQLLFYYRYGPAASWDYFLDLAPLPLDEELMRLCETFSSVDESTRSLWRSGVRHTVIDTLLEFSMRSAALAVAYGEVSRISAGLTAVAMIDLAQVDPRDVTYAFGLIYFAAEVIGCGAVGCFQAAAKLTDPSSAARILEYAESPLRIKEIGNAGFATVQTKRGVAVVRKEFKPYAPRVHLDAVAVEIAELIHMDKYLPRISLATRLPPIWLSSVDDEKLSSVLQNVRAGVTIYGTLRGTEDKYPSEQGFTIFVVEVGDPSDTITLLKISEAKANGLADLAILGKGAGTLFSLVVSRSIVLGKASLETCESLGRFSDGLEVILTRHQSPKP